MRQRIPPNITKEHILLALQELDKNPYPEEHESQKYDLIYEGKRYPPKYVIRTANISANGTPFETVLFSGGNYANNFLTKLGFEIVNKPPLQFMNPLKQGHIITNDELREIFKVGIQGGMRRSTRTNSLILVSDHTKMIYEDRWIGDIFHYTGMKLRGDQSLDFQQNKTLTKSRTNGVNLFLFEVFEEGDYIYIGEVELASDPYSGRQPDIDGKMRNVFIFPLKLKSGVKLPAINEELIKRKEEKISKKLRTLSEKELIKRAKYASKVPGNREVTQIRYERNQAVVELAKLRAKGKCQLCTNPAPFKDTDGIPYLESHHIVWLAREGPDTIENTVALCPNCHKKMHILNQASDIQKLRNIALHTSLNI